MENAEDIDELKLKIIRAVMDTWDLNQLIKVKEMLEEEERAVVEEGSVEYVADPVVGYHPDGSEILQSELEKDIKESLEQFERGEFSTIEEVEERSKNWI